MVKRKLTTESFVDEAKVVHGVVHVVRFWKK